MRVLLDTNAFIWAHQDERRLSRLARETIMNAENELFLSVASAWEIAIKNSIGRLSFARPVAAFVPQLMYELGTKPLVVDFRHALRTADLPLLHKDPFDRLLVAQAQVEDLPILTGDPNIARYDVQVVW